MQRPCPVQVSGRAQVGFPWRAEPTGCPAACTRRASYLQAVQVRPSQGVPDAAVGGWPHGVAYTTQRIDVTGHVVCAYIKLLGVLGE